MPFCYYAKPESQGLMWVWYVVVERWARNACHADLTYILLPGLKSTLPTVEQVGSPKIPLVWSLPPHIKK